MSPIEALRLERTTWSQVEFATFCGIPLATYRRWIGGQTEAKLTVPQLKKVCKELDIKSVDDLPDDFGPVRSQPDPSPGDSEE
ncbi:MAG: helix-turn-helix transcriptional regulator [Chloroflexota bacterium]